MKIIAVGRNYIEHAKELKNPVPDEPVIFLKPETSIIRNNQPFFYPDFSSEIHYETEIVIQICRDGKNDELVKSQKCPGIVIPVKTGIQRFQGVTKALDTVFRRYDDF